MWSKGVFLWSVWETSVAESCGPGRWHCARFCTADLEPLCTLLHPARRKPPRVLAPGATPSPCVCPRELPGGGRRGWGAGGRVDELPNPAGAAATDGGELPEGVAGVVRGRERLAVRLVRVGDVLDRVQHVGEDVLGGSAWSPLCPGLRARCRPGGPGYGCGAVEGEHRRQDVEERQGREPLALLEIREVLG